MEPAIIQVLDLVGTFVFAVTGAVKGVRCRLDIFGVTVLACCVGVGGGMVRDLIIGISPVSALRHEYYIILCIVSGVLIFGTARYWMSIRNIIQIGDAVGLGVFTFLGAQKAWEADLGGTGIILSGVLTAIGGGMIRDVLTGNIPVVLRSDFYATASVIGAACFCFLSSVEMPLLLRFAIVAGTVIALRLLALHFHIQLPAAGHMRHRKNGRQGK